MGACDCCATFECLEPATRDKIKAVVDSWPVQLIVLLATIFAMWGDDVFLAYFPPEADEIMYLLSAICLSLFLIEVVLLSVSEVGYRGSFYFWLDLVAALSMVTDIPVLSNWMVGSFLGDDTDAIDSQLSLSRASRAARVGTRLGRLLRLFRIVRLLRIAKLLKYIKDKATQSDTPPIGNDDDVVDGELTEKEKSSFGAGRIQALGTKISLDIAMRVVLSGMALVVILPLLDYEEVNKSVEYGLREMGLQYNTTISESGELVYTPAFELALNNFYAFHPESHVLYLRINEDVLRDEDDPDLRDLETLQIIYGAHAATLDIKDVSVETAINSCWRTFIIVLVLGAQSGFLMMVINKQLVQPLERMGAFINKSLNLEALQQVESNLAWGRENRWDKKDGKERKPHKGNEIELLTVAFQSVLQANEYLKDSVKRVKKKTEVLRLVGLEAPITAIFRLLETLQEAANMTPTQRQSIQAVSDALASGKSLYMPNLVEDGAKLEAGLLRARQWTYSWLQTDVLDPNTGSSYRAEDDKKHGDEDSKHKKKKMSEKKHNRSKTVSGAKNLVKNTRRMSLNVKQTNTPLARSNAPIREEEAHVFIENLFKNDVMSTLPSEPEKDWNLDMFVLDDATQHHPLLFMSMRVFERWNLFSEFDMDMICFAQFVTKIEGLHENNPFHNNLHAASVVQCVDVMLTTHLKNQVDFSHLEIMALFMAAICHDVTNPGHGNQTFVEQYHTKTIVYNDTAPLQSFACATVFRLLHKRKYNCFRNLGVQEFELFRRHMIELVLHTDLALHFDVVTKLESINAVEAKPSHSLMMKVMLKLADMGYTCMEPIQHLKWSQLLTQELYLQGDAAIAQGLSPAVFTDRRVKQVSTQQRGLFDYIVLPLIQAAYEVLNSPEMSKLQRRALLNRNEWIDKQRIELKEYGETHGAKEKVAHSSGGDGDDEGKESIELVPVANVALVDVGDNALTAALRKNELRNRGLRRHGPRRHKENLHFNRGMSSWNFFDSSDEDEDDDRHVVQDAKYAVLQHKGPNVAKEAVLGSWRDTEKQLQMNALKKGLAVSDVNTIVASSTQSSQQQQQAAADAKGNNLTALNKVGALGGGTLKALQASELEALRAEYGGNTQTEAKNDISPQRRRKISVLGEEEEKEEVPCWATLTLLSSERVQPDGITSWNCIYNKIHIGRKKTCPVKLKHKLLSGQHAQVTRNEEGIWLEDLSTNGVFLEGKRIGKGYKQPLSDGLTFVLCKQDSGDPDAIVFRFDLVSTAASTTVKSSATGALEPVLEDEIDDDDDNKISFTDHLLPEDHPISSLDDDVAPEKVKLDLLSLSDDEPIGVSLSLALSEPDNEEEDKLDATIDAETNLPVLRPTEENKIPETVPEQVPSSEVLLEEHQPNITTNTEEEKTAVQSDAITEMKTTTTEAAATEQTIVDVDVTTSKPETVAAAVKVVAEEAQPAVSLPDGVWFFDDNWSIKWDDNHNAPYFVSSATGQSQWQCPPELTSALALVMAAHNK